MTPIALVLVAALAQATQPPPPPRDRPASVSAPPGAQISGRVVMPDNQPLRRAVVRLTSTALAAPRSVRTDLEGRYAFGKLPAGRFTLKASKAGYLALEYGQRRPFEAGRRLELRGAEHLRNVDVILPKAAAINGVVLDDSGDPAAQMWVVAARAAFRDGRRQLLGGVTTVTNDVGEFRLAGLAPGDYYVIAKERDMRVSDTADDRIGFETTFHPGTAVASDAQPVRVALGQEVVNLGLTMIAARTSTITGRVVDTSGSPVLPLRVSLGETFASPITGGNIVGGGMSGADGRFKIFGVRPGRWILIASRSTDENAASAVEIGAGETREVTLVLGPGGTLAGRIVDDAGLSLAADALSGIELRLAIAHETQLRGYSTTRPKADGAFEWKSLLASTLVRPVRLPDGFWLKAIKRGDVEITDTPVDVAHGAAVSDVTIVLAKQAATLSGTVTNDGKPESDYTVVLFPEGQQSGAALARLVRAERPDHRGSFRITNLPPGAWLAVAVDYVEDGQWLDPAYLESLRPAVTRLALEPAEQKTLDLPLIKRGG